MKFLRHSAALLWAILLLLFVGGELAHGCETCPEHACAAAHGDSAPAPSDHSDESPASPHLCCQSHAALFAMPFDRLALERSPHSVQFLPVSPDSVPESPVREIDHPPQLA